MISVKIKKLIISIMLSVSLLLFTTPIMSFASSKIAPFSVSQSSINYSENKKTILIYSSHNYEEYIEYDIVSASKNLKEKLEKYGYNVVLLEGDFSKEYNSAYFKSRESLLKVDNLKGYDLIIDMHRNWALDSDTVNINNKEFAKTMFVLDQSSVNYKNAKYITETLTKEVNKYGNIMYENTEYPYTSNTHFNQDLGNSVLLEVGNLYNDKWEIQRSLTFVAKAINSYLEVN